MKYWILDENRQPIGADRAQWAEFYESADQNVAKTQVGESMVSTVFLGLDHRFGGDGPPLLFETLVFGGPMDGEMRRYSSWDDAEIGHKAMVRKVTNLEKGQMRILVCGGRDFTDYALMEETLTPRWTPHETVLIHGDAGGADRLSEEWLRRQWPVYDHEIEKFPADWNTHGRSAGPIRNQKMLDEGKPDLVVAFPGGKGTADMVRRARAAGVRVIEVVPIVQKA